MASWAQKREAFYKSQDVGRVELGNGMVAVVDPENWDVVKERTWRPISNQRGDVYAAAGSGGKLIYLHKYIWERVNGKTDNEVDHINLDRLDNRLSNLREASSLQNKGNSKVRKNNKAGFKGVGNIGGKRPWRARIGQVTVGRFDSAEDAAVAYDNAARDLFGEFARVNFPAGEERSAR